MTRNLFFTVLLLVLVCTAYAQGLGVNADGAAPHSSAMLDVNSSSKGVLIPRVALTGTDDITSVPSPAPSLLIYNSATAGSGATAVLPGFYFWNGAAWERVTAHSDLSSSVWTLGGNAGTDTTKHFIGTTDNQPLVFRVNNTRAGLLSPFSVSFSGGNTSWGYGALSANTTGFWNTASGQDALKSNTEGILNTASGWNALYSNTTGNGNTASGAGALYSNTEGSDNTASGTSALYSNTTGTENTASGGSTLGRNTTGSGNTASGYLALYYNNTGNNNTASGYLALYYNTTGNYNTANGISALFSNRTGNNNTALGYFANVSAAGLTNATAIGYRAQVGSDNALVLGSIKGVNQAPSDVNIGIGTTTPGALLHVETGTNYAYGLLVKGTASQQAGSVPDLGAGARMMFYPGKVAFRAGLVSGTQWDNANVGVASTAMGFSTTASGGTSTALGAYSTASSGASTAMGYHSTASGFASTAMGQYTTASGYASTVMGYSTIAKAEGGIAIGEMNDDADQPTSTALPGDRLFQVGNGSDDYGRSNALTVLRNGSMGMGTTTPEASALLDLASSTRGLLVPRMTQVQREAINSPAQGLLVYQTDGTEGFYFYRSTGTPAWMALSAVAPVPVAAKDPSASGELARTVQQQQQQIRYQQQQIDALKKENEALQKLRLQIEQLSQAVRVLSTPLQKQ